MQRYLGLCALGLVCLDVLARISEEVAEDLFVLLQIYINLQTPGVLHILGRK